MAAPSGPPWRPTSALLTAVTATVTALGLAVVMRHPDLAVVAVPFVATLATLALRHPGPAAATATLAVSAQTVTEGVSVEATASVSPPDGVDLVHVALKFGPSVRARHPGSSVCLRPGAELVVSLDLRRWGRVPVGPLATVEYAVHGLLARVGPAAPAQEIDVLPRPDRFDAVEAVPHAAGLIGTHGSRRAGQGVDLHGVREYVPGDRLRRIAWPVTLRTGHLHVTSTTEDRDTEVALIVDSSTDVGPRDPDGASSLDIAVRASAAVAEHYLSRGDRVRLIDLSGRAAAVRLGGGRQQLIRLLDALLDCRPDMVGDGVGRDTRLVHVPPRALGIVFSPLLDGPVYTQLATLAMRGQTLLVVDTLPEDAVPDAPNEVGRLAWRVALLRRAALRDRLTTLGIAMVPWSGAGSLDAVLRELGRPRTAPRRRA